MAGASSHHLTRTAHNLVPSKHLKPQQVTSFNQGLSGPKSGGRRHSLSTLGLITLHATVGVRVSSAVVVEEGPHGRHGLPWGKHSDSALPGGRDQPITTSRITHSDKRAYKRACHRANISPLGGTMYKGRWHTKKSLASLYRPGPHLPAVASQVRSHKLQRPARPMPHVRIFSWNVGGLSSSLFQELMAWLEVNGPWDAVLLQETHWHEVEDFSSGPWSCVHTSGHAADKLPDRSAGVLIMLSKKTFSDITTSELVAGRLLQVRATHRRSQVPVDFLGVYQHVHRTHLSETKNRQLRGQVWHKLQSVLGSIPARHQVVIAGDMNSAVSPAHPHVGCAVPRQAVQHQQDHDLQNLLVDFDFCALNTFHAKPAYTYSSTTTKSQIDFILARVKDSGRGAKTARPIQGFPVAGDRLANHLPIQAVLPICPFQWQPAAEPARQQQYDATALQAAVVSHSCAAQALQQAVAARAALLPEQATIEGTHRCLNGILLEETCRHFPPQPKPDCRVSADVTFRASAKHTWGLYRQMKAIAGGSLKGIWQKWRAYAQFTKASRLLKQQSKQLKAVFHHDQLQRAEHAAKVGDQRGLFQVLKQLAPRRLRGISRLKDAEGRVLSAQAELQAVMDYSKATFACHSDEAPQLALRTGLVFHESVLAQELSRLNPRKSTQAYCAQCCLEAVCRQPLWATHEGPQPSLQGGQPSQVGGWHIRPWLDHLPQYAYCEGRGCADAILRVHQHFEAVDKLLKDNLDNRFKRRQGVATLRCAGGVCLSLDLSKAFDSVSRGLLTQSLQDLGVPGDIIAAIQQLHKEARYHFDVRTQTGHVTTTNGIKQGCRVAPVLWVCFSISVMKGLIGHRDLSWVQRILTLFADDLCACWTITSKADFLQAIRDVELLLELLAIFKLSVNYKKTALLLRLEGKDADRILGDRVFQEEGKTFLRLQVLGRHQSLQIKESHEYLGTKIAYWKRLDLNTDHRIAAAQHKYTMIRRVLNGKGSLGKEHKLRLWQACISTSLIYSLEVVGFTVEGVRKLQVLATRHIRAILRQPVHITRLSNQDLWQATRLEPPGQLVHTRLSKFCAKRDPLQSLCHLDIVTNDLVHASLLRLLESLASTLQRLAVLQETDSPQEERPCPHCDQVLRSEHALKIHIALQHASQPKQAPARHTFRAEAHSVAGMPTCKLCLRNFTKWRQLRLHIELASCPVLGGSSFKLHPAAPDNHLLRRQSAHPNQRMPDQQEGEQSQNFADALPLVLDPSFHRMLQQWDRLLACPDTKARLKQHCVICNMWIMDYRHIRQHYNKTHHSHYPHILPQALELSKAYKSHLTRGRSCRWCGHVVGAPGRHSVQCVVLNQLTVAVCFCRHNLHQQDHESSPDRGRHLPPLYALRAGPSDIRRSAGHSAEPPTGHQQAPEATLATTAPTTADDPDTVPSHLPSSPRELLTRSHRADHGQAVVEARIISLQSPKGHGVCDVLQARSAQHLASTHGSGKGQSGESGGGLHRSSVSLENPAPELPPQRADSASPEGLGHRRRPCQPSASEMAKLGRAVELPALGLQAALPCAGHSPSPPPSRECHSHAQRAAEPHERRDHSSISVDAGPPAHRRRRPSAGDLLFDHLPSSPLRGRRAQRVRSSQRQRLDLSCGDVNEEGRSSTAAPSQAAGAGDLPTPSRPVVRSTDIRAFFKPHPKSHTAPKPTNPPTYTSNPSPSRPHIFPATDHSEHSHSLIPFRTLRNPHNHCYINSSVYCLMILEKALSIVLLPTAFRDRLEAALEARRALGFKLLGWSRPDSQHDVAEFLDFLVPKLAPSQLQYHWQARMFVQGELVRQDQGHFGSCLTLNSIDPGGDPDVQSLIGQWSHQESTHALLGLSSWVFLQLPRSTLHRGRPGKRQHPFVLPQGLRLPFFTGAEDLTLRWDWYVHVACIVHHGPQLAAGHYTTLVRRGSDYWVLDDDKSASVATADQLEHASQNMYILLLLRAELLPSCFQFGSDSDVALTAPLPHEALDRGSNPGTADLPVGANQRAGGRAGGDSPQTHHPQTRDFPCEARATSSFLAADGSQTAGTVQSHSEAV